MSIAVAPADATPRLMMLGIPGYWTGEGCFVTRLPRLGDLRTVTPTTMLHLPLAEMDDMARDDPQAIRYFSFILMMSVEVLLHVVHDLRKSDAARRIASVLYRTGLAIPETVSINQTELGVMANASRKQVNAALARFAEAGWVSRGYRSVVVHDPDALRLFGDEES